MKKQQTNTNYAVVPMLKENPPYWYIVNKSTMQRGDYDASGNLLRGEGCGLPQEEVYRMISTHHLP